MVDNQVVIHGSPQRVKAFDDGDDRPVSRGFAAITMKPLAHNETGPVTVGLIAAEKAAHGGEALVNVARHRVQLVTRLNNGEDNLRAATVATATPENLEGFSAKLSERRHGRGGGPVAKVRLSKGNGANGVALECPRGERAMDALHGTVGGGVTLECGVKNPAAAVADGVTENVKEKGGLDLLASDPKTGHALANSVRR